MKITCNDLSKRYIKDVLFVNLNYTFEDRNKYAILGPNSSGKSTLLKIIGGAVSPTKGEVTYSTDKPPHEIFSFTSPELELLDDYTVKEMFALHFSFRKAKMPMSEQFVHAELEDFLHKKYSSLSSGLKNKVKLALALFTDSPILLLDEPCTNFDEHNTAWYHTMIDRFCDQQMVIVASNLQHEYSFCTEKLTLSNYKK